jgi:heptosyltransferase-2
MGLGLIPKKILIIAPNWVGDSVFMLPALAALKRRFSSASFTLLAKPGIASLHSASPVFERIISFKPGGRLQRFKDHWELRAEGFDLCVVFPPSFSSAFAAWLSGSKERIGRAGEGRKFFLTQSLPAAQRQEHVSREYLALVGLAGAQAEAFDWQVRLPLTPEGNEERQQLFEREGLKSDGSLVALCPTSAYGSSKAWPPSHYAALAQRLKDEGLQPFLLCAPNEEPMVKGIAWDAHGVPVLTPGLKGLASALSQSSVVVANDSGPLHIAAAVGSRVVGLYGPVDPKWSGPLSPRARVLYRGEPCSPCHARECPLKHHDCLEKISVEEVLSAVKDLLQH